LSDPPYYTACPNPFLADFVRCYGTADDPEKPCHREPFAVDVSVGKTDPLYRAHGYHTKVPHLAIVPSILHYTKPGDLVLDGFAGSGMTGVAAQWCGTAPQSYRRQIEDEWAATGFGKPEWGARRALLGDLSPAATFIAANYTLPFDVAAFARAGKRILDQVDRELGWMYETRHTDGRTGRINYTVWSEVFSCPECAGEVVFVEEALNKKTKRVRDDFPCPGCRATLTKDKLDQSFETLIDPATGAPWKRIRLRPVLINYDVGGSTHEKSPDKHDLAVIERAATLPLPPEMPTNAFPIATMYHGSRLAPKGFSNVHHLFLAPAAQTLAALWRRGSTERDSRLRSIVLFFIEQAIWTCSVLNRFRPTGYSQVNQVLGGVYYVPSQHSELALRYVLDGKLTRLTKAFRTTSTPHGTAVNTTGDCADIGLPDAAVDYVFTDPPFGANIPYADLNFVVESWHRVLTNTDTEAIIDHPKRKGLHEYQDLMRRCFAEYHRVLKPGRWMTVVFSNSSNAVWRAIQEAIGTAGFVIAEVRTLDKQQGSYRQETSSAMNQDLVISAYKPTDALARRSTVTSVTEENAWAFVTEHLGNAAPPRAQGSTMEVVKERTAQMLHDRMVAFHVQRDLAVPVSGPEFFAGLARRFPERDGMSFLPEQVADYDRRRARTQEVRQLELFVTDEATAIQWVRQELTKKPQSSQDLVPVFMRQLQAWAKHERMIELRDVLQDNFLRYDGDGPVPPQIHAYLSSNYKDLRNLDKADPKLVAMAR
jgi:hypothetical protein